MLEGPRYIILEHFSLSITRLEHLLSSFFFFLVAFFERKTRTYLVMGKLGGVRPEAQPRGALSLTSIWIYAFSSAVECPLCTPHS